MLVCVACVRACVRVCVRACVRTCVLACGHTGIPFCLQKTSQVSKDTDGPRNTPFLDMHSSEYGHVIIAQPWVSGTIS